jgi:hypothetical protein
MFVPNTTRRREKTGCEGSMVLILDECALHDGDAFSDLGTENSIIPHFIPLRHQIKSGRVIYASSV